MKKINFLKLGFIAALAVYGLVLVRSVEGYGFLDRVDLIAHEAGHMLFSWFGEFLMVAGGTIGQLAVPIAFTVYYFFRKEMFSAAVTLFWVGQNFFNISVYVKDAQAMALPLVSIGGGNDTIHDWNYLFHKFNLLRHDQGIGSMFFGVGFIVMVTAVVLGFYYSVNREEQEASTEGSI